jgi:hypothetical protein
MRRSAFIECSGPAWTNVNAIIERPYRHNSRRRLLGALLTSYELPDSVTLVETLLPEWLGLERPFSEETSEGRCLFFAEMDRALKALHGHLAVFHSADAAPRDQFHQGYPWLFRHVRCFQVGRTRSAIQHSKLWMFHWIDSNGKKSLEMVISSCNLSADALRGQIQAGWRVELPLLGSESRERRRAWGVLPPFLESLGRSSAEGATSIIKEWVALLSRTQPPENALLAASVPGRYSLTELRSQPWGVAGLRNVVPLSWSGTEIDALVPSIGVWNAEAIRKWASFAKSNSNRLRIAWPPKETHRFKPDAMSLPPSTYKAFKRAGVELLAFPPEDAERRKSILHPDHDIENDPRWPHCKLYWFGRRGGRRDAMLLVTSANLSKAAWGAWQGNRLQIENFELGVAFNTRQRPLLKLQLMEGQPHIGGTPERASGPAIAWADASWDGRCIIVEARLANSQINLHRARLTLMLDSHKQRLSRAKFRRNGNLHRAKFIWRAHMGIPASVELRFPPPAASGGFTSLVVPIADLRSPQVTQHTPCPEIPEDWLRTEGIRLLIERYGGRLADQEDTAQIPTTSQEVENDVSQRTDFRVEVIEESRRNWRIIDVWQAEVDDAAGTTRILLLRDGRQLRDYWNDLSNADEHSKTSGKLLAAGLAARELDFRLRRIGK